VALAAASLAFAWLGGCGRDVGEPVEDSAAQDHGDAPALELSTEQQQKLGIGTAELVRAEFQPALVGVARVLDAQAVVTALAELAKAETDARTSAAAVKRARDLFATDTAVSAETLEAAQRQAAADDAQLRVARAHATLEFGAGAPWLDAARREPLLAALAEGSAVVISASFPAGFAGTVPARLVLRRVGAAAAEESWSATEVWTGPADPAVPGRTFAALVGAPRGLSAGDRLTVSVPTGDALSGVVVPASALVLAGGGAWCYVSSEDATFARRALATDRPVGSGYFQAAGFAPGERVVVAGAGLLLARETGGAEAD
jgi:hypothetical protein